MMRTYLSAIGAGKRGDFYRGFGQFTCVLHGNVVSGYSKMLTLAKTGGSVGFRITYVSIPGSCVIVGRLVTFARDGSKRKHTITLRYF